MSLWKMRYEAEVDLFAPIIECNCSHFQIKGLLLTFIPEASFTITSGGNGLSKYLFNTNKIEHHFAPRVEWNLLEKEKMQKVPQQLL